MSEEQTMSTEALWECIDKEREGRLAAQNRAEELQHIVGLRNETIIELESEKFRNEGKIHFLESQINSKPMMVSD